MHTGPDLPLATGRTWLAEAGRSDRAGPSKQPVKKEVDGTTVFKRRRCQNCLTMTEYAKQCPKCGELMDYCKDQPSADIDDIIKEQTL